MKSSRTLLSILLLICSLQFVESQSERSEAPKLRISVPATAANGSPVRVDITLSNPTTHTLQLFRDKDNFFFYDISVSELSGRKIKPSKFLEKYLGRDKKAKRTGSVQMISIPPSGSYLDTVELSQYYEMTEPGVYSIQFSHSGEKSNVVTVTVK